MKFQYLKLKNGKFVSYGSCVVPTYDAYCMFIAHKNKNSTNGFTYRTC